MDADLGEPISGQLSHDSSDIPHEMRITSGGKIRNYIAFALRHFQDSPNRPLILTTYPKEDNAAADFKKAPSTQSEAKEDGTMQPSAGREKKKHGSWNGIPRLISVVELIKREFTADAEIKHRQALKDQLDLALRGTQEQTQISSLHQYNEVGILKDERSDPADGVSEDTARRQRILSMLTGKNHLKVQHEPFMRITLSIRPLVDYGNATYQPPPPPKKRSKNALKRAKKRARLDDVNSTGLKTREPAEIDDQVN